MILEIVSSLIVGSGLGYMKLKQGTSETNKIERIAKNCGLFIKEDKTMRTIQLLRRSLVPGGTEYAYRVPLGLSFQDFQSKLEHFQDGLNNKKTVIDVKWNDIKQLELGRDFPGQVRALVSQTAHIRKEVEMEYDGLLKIRVYNQPLTASVPYTEQSGQGWGIPLGISRNGPVSLDPETFQMIIVAGIPRYGKTVFLKLLITHLIHQQPKHASFTLIDLKGGLAFNRFKRCSQVHCVAQNAMQARDALKQVQRDMETRMSHMLSRGYEDIKESSIKDRHFIVVDEGAELSSKGETDPEQKKIKMECESILSDIARRGAGIGFRLVYATQYPTMDTIPRQVKRNAVARICFPLDTSTASQTVLDEGGAETLPLVPGRAIYKTDRKQVIQTTFISNEQIQKLIAPHIRKEIKHVEPIAEVEPRGSYSLDFEKI